MAPLNSRSASIRWRRRLNTEITPTRAAAAGPSSTTAAALVGVISVFSLRRHLMLAERLFNGAMYALSGYAAGSAYVALGGTVGRLGPHPVHPAIWPFAAAAAVHVITNHGLLWGALQLSNREGRPRERVRVESSLP